MYKELNDAMGTPTSQFLQH